MVEIIEKMVSGSQFPARTREEYAQNDLQAMLAATKAFSQGYDYASVFKGGELEAYFYMAEKDPHCQEVVSFAESNGYQCVVIKGYTRAQAHWDAKKVAPILIDFITV